MHSRLTEPFEKAVKTVERADGLLLYLALFGSRMPTRAVGSFDWTCASFIIIIVRTIIKVQERAIEIVANI